LKSIDAPRLIILGHSIFLYSINIQMIIYCFTHHSPSEDVLVGGDAFFQDNPLKRYSSEVVVLPFIN